MHNKHAVLLILPIVLMAPAIARAAGSDLESDIEYLMEVDDFLHPEIAEKWQRVVGQGERLYPIIARKLERTSDPFGVSRLLSMVVESKGDKAQILPAIHALVESNRAQKHPHMLVRVAQTLGKIGGEADVPVLLDLFGHDEKKVRINAIRGLSQIAGAQAVQQIQQIIENRAAGLSREEIRKDPTFLEGYLAIAHIQYRALMESAPQE